ncbi:MAG: hypothetical protein WC712_04625 [Candidatus Brocadiia bacterium]
MFIGFYETESVSHNPARIAWWSRRAEVLDEQDLLNPLQAGVVEICEKSIVFLHYRDCCVERDLDVVGIYEMWRALTGGLVTFVFYSGAEFTLPDEIRSECRQQYCGAANPNVDSGCARRIHAFVEHVCSLEPGRAPDWTVLNPAAGAACASCGVIATAYLALAPLDILIQGALILLYAERDDPWGWADTVPPWPCTDLNRRQLAQRALTFRNDPSTWFAVAKPSLCHIIDGNAATLEKGIEQLPVGHRVAVREALFPQSAKGALLHLAELLAKERLEESEKSRLCDTDALRKAHRDFVALCEIKE